MEILNYIHGGWIQPDTNEYLDAMAFFPFSGWKDSYFGDMDGQGMDAEEFLT